MIISHKHQFCFVHIPKNGGSFVKSIFEKYHDDPVKFYGVKKLNPIGIIKDLSHINFTELIKLFGANECQPYFKFCFVRDPVERFMSGYVEYMHHVLKYFSEAPKKVSALLKTIEDESVLLKDARYTHLVPQTFYTHDRQGKKICEIYQMNDLDNEVQSISQRLKISVDRDELMNPLNKNSGKSQAFNTKFVLTPEDLEKIHKIYRKDFEWLGFPKKLNKLNC